MNADIYILYSSDNQCKNSIEGHAMNMQENTI